MPNIAAVTPAERYPTAHDVGGLGRAVARVRSRIAAAAERAGRSPDEVRLLPVSKTVPEDRLRLAVQAGCRELGENKVQEAARKRHALADLDVRWSVIGHLQTNKAREVATWASELQALDRLRVAEALDRRLAAAGRTLDVHVQVNTSAEDSKFGLPPDELPAFLAALPAYPHLRVRGLMTLAVLSDDPARVRECFALLRTLRDRARDTDPDLVGPGELSMGMSGDYEIAVEEGATCVRVGQAIFGARAVPDSVYWPGATRDRR
ncbi:YggS family pyridoxal phosphate-dependent enzyme [Cellulomonas sp. HD19AZ1]|uniref:YggS family pyridoxal phosphate-dependent enzyme n=1 Tax=Cellulomonas sp. HD19AZ1 TaxID=2559593 RepID=UPI001070A9F1|nr:YggS family pyridoxal phosphate-dependent enzyme [Cellulomonas sp. HD19AZ1]TFH71910.1 YggS family pyridoxal phosphate-dependent enzyme [Cellulomonas sp. HD19AZ1]